MESYLSYLRKIDTDSLIRNMCYVLVCFSVYCTAERLFICGGCDWILRVNYGILKTIHFAYESEIGVGNGQELPHLVQELTSQ